jgi:arylsulfatase A-like enzyme
MKTLRVALFASVLLVLVAALVHFRVARAQNPRPNIVVIMTDDQDVDSLPVMEYLMSYPYGSWVNFEYAFAGNSVCCPARATLLTGQYSHTHGVQNNNMGRKMQDSNTLPVWLDGAGYTTALIGKYLNGFPFPGYSRRNPPGWDLFEHIRVDGNADMYTAEAVDFLQTAREPFFLFLAYRAPHQPAKPLPRYKTVTPPFVPKDRLRPNFNEKDMDDKPPGGKRKPIPAAVMARYEAERLASQRELMGIDDGVESIIATLQAQGQLDNTMIIFLGDNGFSWGAHRHYGKHCAYDECSRIPLLIRYPELSGNHVESRLVSNVDLASTIADYAGVTPGIVQEGRSLLPLMERPGRPWRSAVLLERVGLGYNAIRTDEWKYIQRLNGGIELYDMRADPYELENLAGKPEYAAVQSQLVAEMMALLGPHAYTLSGTVTDEDGLGLAGVAITEGGGRRVMTDSAGH